jgi:hypothetical protein
LINSLLMWRSGFVVFVLVGAACADSSGLLVIVDAEGLSRVRGSDITMVARDQDGAVKFDERIGPDALPYRLLLTTPSDGRRFGLRVELLDTRDEVFSRVALDGALSTGELAYAGACLRDDCIDVLCGGGETCRAGACVVADVTTHPNQDDVPPCWTQRCAASETVCDGIDDDCNGAIDEGLTNACGACGSLGDDVCDGGDNDCDGTVDEGVTNACGGCGPLPMDVCDGRDNDCDGVCDPPGACRVAIYHGYHPGQDHHLYCRTTTECMSSGVELRHDGRPVFYLYERSGPDLLPLRRCNVGNGAHYFTLSSTCADPLQTSGTPGYAMASPLCGATRLYELTHVNGSGETDYIYTVDELERALILSGGDWVATEGREIYAWAPPPMP